MKLDSLMNDCRAMIENFSIRVAPAAFAEHHVSLLGLEELAAFSGFPASIMIRPEPGSGQEVLQSPSVTAPFAEGWSEH